MILYNCLNTDTDCVVSGNTILTVAVVNEATVVA